MEKPKTLGISVKRAELRKRKIILTLEPDLLTDEVFAVNPFYDEGELKNKLKEVNIVVYIKEQKGVVEAKAEYYGTHYTTGHTQLHASCGLNSYYLSKKDCAIAEILKTDYKYIKDDSRMNKLLSNWENEPEFKATLIDLINDRKTKHRNEKLKEAMSNYDTARKELEDALNLNGFEKPRA